MVIGYSIDKKRCNSAHDDVIKWKHFPRYWPFVRGIHRSPVNSPHKSQWRGALIFSLICAWMNGWVNNCEAGDLRRHRAHYDVIVMTRQYDRPTFCWWHFQLDFLERKVLCFDKHFTEMVQLMPALIEILAWRRQATNHYLNQWLLSLYLGH